MGLAVVAGCNGPRHPPPLGDAAGERDRERSASPSAAHPGRRDDPASAPPVAVVELFTSEGCSSCPPADEVLRRVRQRTTGRPVVLLAYHVDFWDDLGWPDRFASTAAAERQRAYARRLGERGVYTPELVVDGRDAFVGSDEARAANAIDSALARSGRGRIALEVAPEGARSLAVRFGVTGIEGAAQLLVAVTEDGVSSRVSRGENAGKTLRHDAVVRTFEVTPLREPSGRRVVDVPGDLVRDNAHVVAVVQGAATFEVICAASAPIP